MLCRIGLARARRVHAQELASSPPQPKPEPEPEPEPKPEPEPEPELEPAPVLQPIVPTVKISPRGK